jgi:FAD/FMN-containing dehydrogenase/Fe-S oxidoreductase
MSITLDAAPPPQDADLAELVGALDRELEGETRADPYTLHMYSRDASMYAVEPLAVAFPRSADDVEAAIAVARAADVSILPRGAGTSLAGQTVGRSVVLDFSRHMRSIRRLDVEARSATVQPGVVQDQLNRAAATHGLMFGADTSTSNRATLGGMIGNNSSGSHSILYGTTADHVTALDVMLSDATHARLTWVDGTERERRARAPTLEGAIYRGLPEIAAARREAIIRDHPSLWRHSGGYRLDRLVADDEGLDLARFVVGSEGTLAVVTQADVGLVPRPAAQAIALGHFDSTREAVAATADALELGAAAVELIDETILELSRRRHEYAKLTSLLEGQPRALLFVTFFGDSESELAAQVDRLEASWRRHGHGYHTLRAVTPGDRAALLKVRKASLGLLMAASRGTRRPLAFVEDTAVDPRRLEEYVARFEQILDQHGMRAGFYGHCSVGCLHIRPFVDLTNPAERQAMRAVAEEVLELVMEFSGVNSSEHGDGLVRSELNERLFGTELYEGMRAVKRLFDPDGRLNPGKIVDAPSLLDNLRDPALPAAQPLPTTLRFAEPGGMRGAADRCMNIGLCRKDDAGTMCPSYMATRAEEHSTRGRAGALVKALSSPDPRRALGDDRLHEMLDLCLECKACKSECPLAVDMASLKSEVLSHRHAIHGTPLRSRLFGRIRALNRLGASLAPVSNLPARARPLRVLMERTLGISARRPLPRFQHQTLMRWYRRREPPVAAPRGDVVFLADSFTSYTEPEVACAAIELLERAGWRVLLESRFCCGRSSLSKGLLEQARAMASETVLRLAPHAARGVPIVGCEPSCLLTLRDEYLDLLPDDRRVEMVAQRVVHVAELLLEAIRDGDLRLDPASELSGRRIVFHGHCHEKAVTGTAASMEVLRQIPGAEVEELDAGCCGMAGSFGFESEHYDLSLQIGGLRLFPVLAAQADDVVVSATGVSCRQQIAHGAGLTARHPLELVRLALAR